MHYDPLHLSQLCRIDVDYSWLLTLNIWICASRESGVADRAVADLNRAIAHAKRVRKLLFQSVTASSRRE